MGRLNETRAASSADGVSEVLVHLPGKFAGESVCAGAEWVDTEGSEPDPPDVKTPFAHSRCSPAMMTESGNGMNWFIVRALANFAVDGKGTLKPKQARILFEGQSSVERQRFSIHLAVVPPPVLLIHAFQSDPGKWDDFWPDPQLAADLAVFRLDYSRRVRKISSVPDYPFLTEFSGASLGFRYNAHYVFPQPGALLDKYRTRENPWRPASSMSSVIPWVG